MFADDVVLKVGVTLLVVFVLLAAITGITALFAVAGVGFLLALVAEYV